MVRDYRSRAQGASAVRVSKYGVRLGEGSLSTDIVLQPLIEPSLFLCIQRRAIKPRDPLGGDSIDVCATLAFGHGPTSHPFSGY